MSDTINSSQITPDLSSVISSLMANPEVMSAISSLKKETVAPRVEDNHESAPASLSSGKDLSLEKLLPMISGLSTTVSKDKKGGSSLPAVCLLNALKPYLSPHRQEAVETIVRLSSVSEMLGSINKTN